MQVMEAPAPTEEQVETYLGSLSGYATGLLKIKTKNGLVVPLVFNEAQQIVQDILSAQAKAIGKIRAIILKARQLGISTEIAARNYRRVHLIAHQKAGVIADKKDRASTLFDIYRMFNSQLPAEWRPTLDSNARGKHLIYNNKAGTGLGSEIFVGTAGDAAEGRASTYQALHLSELAFWPNAAEVLVGLLQSVPDEDSEVVIESTANGVGGEFHERWEAAVEGESEYIAIFLPWFIHAEYRVTLTAEEKHSVVKTADRWESGAMIEGLEFQGQRVCLSPEQIAWRRRKIKSDFKGSVRAFQQEYPSDPEEAFLVSGACFFEQEKLKAHRAGCVAPIARGNMVSTLAGGLYLQQEEFGYTSIWKFPNPHGRYVIGGDTAEGKMASSEKGSFDDPEAERGGRDFCAAYVYDLDTHEVVAEVRGRMAPEVFASQLWSVGYFYCAQPPPGQKGFGEPAFLGLERNHASGETALRKLKEDMHYPNLFYMRELNHRTRRVTMQLGWQTSADSRMPMLDELADYVNNDRFKVWDMGFIKECLTFVRADDGRPAAQSGCHDDRVMAMGVTLQMARWAPAPSEGEFPAEEPVLDSPTGLNDYGDGPIDLSDRGR